MNDFDDTKQRLENWARCWAGLPPEEKKMNIFDELTAVVATLCLKGDPPPEIREKAGTILRMAGRFKAEEAIGHRDFHSGHMKVDVTDRPLERHEARVIVLHVGDKNE